MRDRHVMVAAVLVLLAFLGPARSAAVGADDPTKGPDARQTAQKFLDAALAGRAKEAAALGEPGKSYSREGKMKECQDIGVEKLAFVIVNADDQFALAITEKIVEPKRKQEGQLTLRLVKKDKRWLIRDVDFRTEEKAKEQL